MSKWPDYKTNADLLWGCTPYYKNQKKNHINYGNLYLKIMYIYNTQIKNKRIENVTCPKSLATEPKLHYKITLMYKYCWHWTNQCPINSSAGKQWNSINYLFKVSQHTVNQRRRNRWHMSYLHETNQYLVSKQDRKQITRIVTCSK